MKPEELSDAIIEFQSKHAVSDTTLAFASHLSVEKVHAMKQGRGNFTSEKNQPDAGLSPELSLELNVSNRAKRPGFLLPFFLCFSLSHFFLSLHCFTLTILHFA